MWTDQATGEVWDSYTMLTINTNLHPLMSRMHKIERDPMTKQLILGKRSVVPLAAHDFDRWVTCTMDEARKMLLLPSVDVIDAGPAAAGVAPQAEDEATEASYRRGRRQPLDRIARGAAVRKGRARPPRGTLATSGRSYVSTAWARRAI